VAARLGVGSAAARALELRVRLLDERGGVLATQELGRARGSVLTAWLPVDQLQPGLYRLELAAVSNGEVVARGEDVLRIGLSPFESGR